VGLVEHRAAGVAGDDRRDEDKPDPALSAGRATSTEQPARSLDVDLVDLASIALRRYLRREVNHAIGTDALEQSRQHIAVTEIPGGGFGPQGFGARPPHECRDRAFTREKLRAYGMPEEAAGAGDECLHRAILPSTSDSTGRASAATGTLFELPDCDGGLEPSGQSAGGRLSVWGSGTPSSSSFSRSISALTSAPNSKATLVSHSQTSRMIAAANDP
jgi:hypothetical protein